MPNEKYVVPEMDIIEFGNEDLVCVISGVHTTDPSGGTVEGPGFGGSWDGGDFEG